MTDGEVVQEINARKRKNTICTVENKRVKCQVVHSSQIVKLSKVIFPRSRIFYGLGTKVRSGQKLIVGFPRDHALQKIKSSQIQMHDLLQIVFPACFGLPSILNSHTSIPVVDQTVTPKRLAKVVNLFHKLVYRHSVCNYEALLENYCPKMVIFLH